MTQIRPHALLAVLALLLLLAVPVQAQDPGDRFATDQDEDGVVDGRDACPSTAGDPANDGCPADTPPPDADNDGTPDLYDRCPDAPGADNDACPDTDADGTPDPFDLCPDSAADVALAGCPLVRETDVPTSAVLTPENAPQLLLLGALALPVEDIAVNRFGTMAVLGPDGVITPYNLNADRLVPTLQADVATLVFTRITFDPVDRFPVLYVDSLTTAPAYTLAFPDFAGLTTTLSADGARLAAAETVSPQAEPLGESVVEVYRIGGELLSAFSVPGTVRQVAFSPVDADALWIATDAALLQVAVSTGEVLATQAVGPDDVSRVGRAALALTPGAERAALGFGLRGEVALFPANPLADATLRRATADTCPADAVTHLDFSPDGRLLAVATDCSAIGFDRQPGTARPRVIVLDATTGEPLADFTPTQPPRRLRFAPSGDMLVVATNTSVQFWGVLQ